MEAMSIESLLLSAWEEEGFVGRTRVPVGRSDVDVLAIRATDARVRIGESKVREGSQKVYLVDEFSLADMEQQPHNDFTAWMGDGWSRWLANLPRLWDKKGRPAVPWLLPASRIKQVQVVFCCNFIVWCERPEIAHAKLRRAVLRVLRRSALADRLKSPGFIVARLTPTIEVVADLLKSVFHRIEPGDGRRSADPLKPGFGRRFGDPFKDLFREIHRYLRPALDRLPYNRKGETLRESKRRAPYEEEIRQRTISLLLKAMDVSEHELRKWVAGSLGSAGEPGNEA